jgi:hypothetical protein
MTHINKTNVDLWPPAGYENALTAFSILYHNQIGLSWVYDGTPVTNFRYATLGRPLKFDDFKDYVMMPLYEYTHSATGKSYWAGAAIRYASDTEAFNFGVYVHMSPWKFWDGMGEELSHDFAMGYISTAAAIWADVGASAWRIYDAHKAIEWAKREGRTSGLTQAENLYRSAVEAFEAGRYKMAWSYAKQAEKAAENAFAPNYTPLFVVAATILVASGAGVYWIRNRKNKKEEQQSA